MRDAETQREKDTEIEIEGERQKGKESSTPLTSFGRRGCRGGETGTGAREWARRGIEGRENRRPASKPIQRRTMDAECEFNY